MIHDSERKIRDKHGWAIEIVRSYFSAGLSQICDADFLRERHKEFIRKNDPIYTNLLLGMDDSALEQTFVSFFTIFQTLATQSRFWLDDAIAQIVTQQAIRQGRNSTEVYSSSMLRNGQLRDRRTVADLGENQTEHVSNQRAWKEIIKNSALERIDVLVGQEERGQPPKGQNSRKEPRNNARILADQKRDEQRMEEVVASITGIPSQQVTLQCNLLVIEPDINDNRPHAWAIRYINPKTFARPDTRKQERVNMLRLYALLVQEKILRNPKSISVCVAELMPRRVTTYHADNYPEYFSSKTYWPSQNLWEFIGLPFDVVQFAISDVAKEFRDRLKSGLRGLLPDNSKSKQDFF